MIYRGPGFLAVVFDSAPRPPPSSHASKLPLFLSLLVCCLAWPGLLYIIQYSLVTRVFAVCGRLFCFYRVYCACSMIICTRRFILQAVSLFERTVKNFIIF